MEPFTPRQNAVLECALQLLVAGGERALTTAGLARAANCSKESLYKWFGDRDGLLAAMITYQASKVRTPGPRETVPTLDDFTRSLVVFAEDLIGVLSGEVSLALNRLAIGQADRDGARLGALLREHGRQPIELRARALLELGRRHGYVQFADTREAYETLYGLIVHDGHVRMLLGEPPAEMAEERARRARLAISQFFRLYGHGAADIE
jgi:AcrR family transcriptional regulator